MLLSTIRIGMLPIPIHDTAVTTKCIARAEKIYRTFYILMHEFLWNGHAAFGCLLLQYQAVLQPPQRRSFGPGDPQFPHHGSFSLFSHLVFALCATVLNRLSSRARSILCIRFVKPLRPLRQFLYALVILIQHSINRPIPPNPLPGWPNWMQDRSRTTLCRRGSMDQRRRLRVLALACGRLGEQVRSVRKMDLLVRWGR
jgi:hypothetical protein